MQKGGFEKQPGEKCYGQRGNLVVLPGQGDKREVSLGELLLRERVAALEERLEQMKLSRRVLMKILERSEQEKQVVVANLRRENERLRQQNGRLIKIAWNRWQFRDKLQ